MSTRYHRRKTARRDWGGRPWRLVRVEDGTKIVSRRLGAFVGVTFLLGLPPFIAAIFVSGAMLTVATVLWVFFFTPCALGLAVLLPSMLLKTLGVIFGDRWRVEALSEQGQWISLDHGNWFQATGTRLGIY